MFLKRMVRNYVDRMAKNPLKGSHERRALLSYIARPLRRRRAYTAHTNYNEVLAICEVLDELGYIVDVIHFQHIHPGTFRHYDLIIGFGAALEQALASKRANQAVVFYGTGMAPERQNTASIGRLLEAFSKTNIWMIDSCRLVQFCWPLQTSIPDGMILLGNDVTRESYENFVSDRIRLQNVSCHPAIREVKSISLSDESGGGANDSGFVWFGSAGALHKGLDLLIDVFSSRTDAILHICGPVAQEKSFWDYYEKIVSKNDNIYYHGFVDIKSNKFIEIVSSSKFVIHPSCAEGQPSSVVNLMATGLIPIVSQYSGINVPNVSICIESLNETSVEKAVDVAQNLSDEEFHVRRRTCMEWVRANHSIEAFKDLFKRNVSETLEDISARRKGRW